MKLPCRENALVPRAKLENYLLSLSYQDGRSKAKFLRVHGYHDENVNLLSKQLIEIIQFNDVEAVVPSGFGKKYVVDGNLAAPDGEILSLRTVWIIEDGSITPRFVTGYPR